MCDDVDNQEKSDSSDYETDEEWEIERKKQQAAMEKDAVSLYICTIIMLRSKLGWDKTVIEF